MILDKFVGKVHVGDSDKQALNQQSVRIVYQTLSGGGARKINHSRRQFILKIGGVVLLTAHTGFAGTALSPGCLFTLKTKHF